MGARDYQSAGGSVGARASTMRPAVRSMPPRSPVDSSSGFGDVPGVRLALRSFVLSLVAATALGGAGCHRDKCVAACEKISKERGCAHADKCKAQCETLHKSPVCNAEMKVFETCFLKEPAIHWNCDDDGIPALMDAFCQLERGQVVGCLDHAPPPAAPAPAPPAPVKPAKN
jgi:hypothetical protein